MKSWILPALIFLVVAHVPLKAAGPKPVREEGEFRISINGNEIGGERFIIITAGDSCSSSSVLDFRIPGNRNQRVQLETKLEMGPNYLPKDYQLKSEVDGQKGLLHGVFTANQAIFEFSGAGTPRKTGLLIGNNFTLLDTNIFHHFIFLARLYKYGSKEKSQRFEVVIPQEQDNGQVVIKDLGRETLAVGNKKLETRRLQVDSGAIQISLWVDSHQLLHRIEVPDKGIQVLRNR